ncbi:MAG TPA: hypothetical protein VKW76_16150, partial [Candidatus Binatia bacterium]|nr:hypothetical protein [Candidatus Binatia bacterium]
ITSIVGTTVNLGGLAGPPGNCSLGTLSTSHCGIAFTTPCTSNAQCTAIGDSCVPDAQCYFSQPFPIPNPSTPSLSTCVQNVVASNESGTVSNYTTTGDVALNVPLSSRVYLTGNGTSPCPQCVNTTCVSGHCTGKASGKACTTAADCVNTCNAGRNQGLACSPVGTLKTTLDCPPTDSTFVTPLSIPLALTTGTTTDTNATGIFCSGQTHAGAFGQSTARTIKQTGAALGNVSDGAAHAGVIAGSFCVPKTGNFAIDPVADLPGPGTTSINGTMQLQ